MSYKMMHFNNAGQVIKKKKMTKEIGHLMEYLHDALYGTMHKGEIMRQVLTEMDWRNDNLNVLDGRRYCYKGLRNRIALDGSFSSYEYLQGALLRLQIGFDKKRIDAGIVFITSQRSEKSKLGTTEELAIKEMEMLQPTIHLPVLIVLFDLGRPGELYAENLPDENHEETFDDYQDYPERQDYGNDLGTQEEAVELQEVNLPQGDGDSPESLKKKGKSKSNFEHLIHLEPEMQAA